MQRIHPVYHPELPTIDSLNTHQIGLQFMNSATLTPDGKSLLMHTPPTTKLGFCMKEGMTHTLQLTAYVMDNFRVTGQVFLIGLSMGGQIAKCLLINSQTFMLECLMYAVTKTQLPSTTTGKT